MKVRCRIDLNLESGEYSMNFENISKPGSPIEYNEVKDMLEKVFAQTSRTIEKGEDSQVVKVVH